MKRVNDLGEKIYLIVYGKPKYKLEISKKIYGKESKSIYPEIKKLEQKGWIKQIKYKDVETRDKRAERRQYYYTNVKPLFNSICQDLKEMQTRLSASKKKINIELTNIERKKLLHLLDSKVFRVFVGDFVNKVEHTDGLDHPSFCFSTVKSHFSSYCTFALWFEIFYISNNLRGNEEFDKLSKQINKKYEAKTNFADISEGILSFDFRMIEKLTYLDYRNSNILLTYLSKVVSILCESETASSVLEENPLSKFLPVGDVLDFSMFYKGEKSLISL